MPLKLCDNGRRVHIHLLFLHGMACSWWLTFENNVKVGLPDWKNKKWTKPALRVEYPSDTKSATTLVYSPDIPWSKDSQKYTCWKSIIQHILEKLCCLTERTCNHHCPFSTECMRFLQNAHAGKFSFSILSISSSCSDISSCRFHVKPLSS